MRERSFDHRDMTLTGHALQGTTIQLLCFLGAEFPVQFLTKRYGFKNILPGVWNSSHLQFI
jgi:hypothetical protein